MILHNSCIGYTHTLRDKKKATGYCSSCLRWISSVLQIRLQLTQQKNNSHLYCAHCLLAKRIHYMVHMWHVTCNNGFDNNPLLTIIDYVLLTYMYYIDV